MGDTPGAAAERLEVDALSIDLAAQHVYERQGYRRYAESYRYLRKG